MSTTDISAKKIFLTGHTGQLGSELLRILKDKTEVKLFVHKDGCRADLADHDLLESSILAFRPDIIVNSAAYTAVDRAESDSLKADEINHQAVGLMARLASRIGASMIHFSTDYVFNGDPNHQPWVESDTIQPLSVYGRTKAQGENVLRETLPRHLIFRTSWVYSWYGHNFMKTILKLSGERELLRIVNDQVGAPTAADFLALATFEALHKSVDEKFSNWGTYHLCSSGQCSWFDFASAIVRLAKEGEPSKVKVQKLDPIPSSEYPTPARRPLNSRLDCEKFDRFFSIDRETWEDGLKRNFDKLLSEIKSL